MSLVVSQGVLGYFGSRSTLALSLEDLEPEEVDERQKGIVPVLTKVLVR